MRGADAEEAMAVLEQSAAVEDAAAAAVAEWPHPRGGVEVRCYVARCAATLFGRPEATGPKALKKGDVFLATRAVADGARRTP